MLFGMSRGILFACVAGLVLLGCLSGSVSAVAILLISNRTSASAGIMASPTPTGAATLTVAATASATRAATAARPTPTTNGAGAGPTPTPTFPPATPQPPLYSLNLASKVYGQAGSAVGMNMQVWPPDRNAQLRIIYDICPAQGSQTVVMIPPWSDQGLGEVNLNVGACWKQGSTIQLDVIAYWSTGQTARLTTTAPISW
jgi:hypothetical protein